MRRIFAFSFYFAFLLHASAQTCLPGGAVVADYPATAATLQNLFTQATQSAELNTAAYEDLKTRINRCNNDMEVALGNTVSQMSERSLQYQQILGYKDVAGIEKQLRDLEESRRKSREELAQNLGYVKHSGVYVVLLENVDFYKSEKKDLIEQANQAITPRAVDDLVGLSIRRSSAVSAFAPVRDVIQEIKNGEVRMEREYFNQSNHARKSFLFVARIGAVPAREKASGAAPAGANALVLNLAVDGDFRQRLLTKGVSEADIRRLEQEVVPFLSTIQRDNRTADERQDYILQNGVEEIRRLEREIEDARLRLQTRSAKIAEICKELAVPFNPGSNFDQSVNGALQKIRDQLAALTTQWNSTVEQEIVYKETRTFVEGSLSQSLATETLKLCQQIEKGYGQLDRILQVTEVQDFELSRFESNRTLSVFRKPNRIWAYAMPREDGAYGVAVFVQFKVTGQQAGGGDGGGSVAHKAFEPEMVLVEGGRFQMGCTAEQGSDCSDNEKPAHKVTLSAFYLATTEVTQAQWRAAMGSDPPELYNKNCDQCPVDKVSWDDVQEFIKKINQQTGRKYRLPTEAEWEYAARGGNKNSNYQYAGSNSIDAVAWYTSNSKMANTFGDQKTTHPVGSKLPNGLGLFDMSGNVWEWCSDWYGSDYYKNSPSSNPTGPTSGSYRVRRGGSWSDDPLYCRVADRDGSKPGYSNSGVGFRLARTN